MKRSFFTFTLVALLALAYGPAAMAQSDLVNPDDPVSTDKIAQTGFKFLSNSVDARAAAMGSAVSAELNGNSISMFYNPAGMAAMTSDFHASAATLSFIADINYNIASVAFRPKGGNWGVFGLSLIAVDYGDFIGTVRAANESGFEETGTFSPTALAIGLGYARTLTDRFSVGGHVKYAKQDLGSFPTARSGTSFTFGDFDLGTLAYDFGVVYETGWKSLALAFTARNFAQEQTYVRENFELPLTLQFGVTMNILDLTSMDPNTHALRLNVDVQRPRDFDEHVRFGAEYSLMDTFFLRGGFEQLGLNEEQGVSLGAGVRVDAGTLKIGADYAYTDFGVFDSVNRIGVQIGF